MPQPREYDLRMGTHKRWGDLVRESPDIAEAGQRLLYQGADVASAYLATVAPDQGPRVHPVYPVVSQNDLWLFIVNLSPKYRDLGRNGWFALHTLPTPKGGEEFYLRGHANEVADPSTKATIVDATDGRQGSSDFEALFRCELISALYTKWENWGTAEPWPGYSKWRV